MRSPKIVFRRAVRGFAEQDIASVCYPIHKRIEIVRRPQRKSQFPYLANQFARFLTASWRQAACLLFMEKLLLMGSKLRLMIRLGDGLQGASRSLRIAGVQSHISQRDDTDEPLIAAEYRQASYLLFRMRRSPP